MRRRRVRAEAVATCARTASTCLAASCTSCPPTACGCAIPDPPASRPAWVRVDPLGVQRVGQVRQLPEGRAGAGAVASCRVSAVLALRPDGDGRLVLEGGGIEATAPARCWSPRSGCCPTCRCAIPDRPRRLRAHFAEYLGISRPSGWARARRRRHARPRGRRRALRRSADHRIDLGRRFRGRKPPQNEG